jgi:hypothetical protein
MCSLQGIALDEELNMEKGRINWALFRTCASKLLPELQKYPLMSQAVTVTAPLTPASVPSDIEVDPEVAEVASWLNTLKFSEQSDLAKQSQLTFSLLHLAVSDAASMESRLAQLKLSGDKATLFKKELRNHMLSQSIQSWLNEVEFSEYFDKLKENRCSTFRALFEAHDNDELFDEVLEAVGLNGVEAKMFKRHVKSKKEEMLGTGAQ